jgi:outer membrane protein, heavy metal efflux system
VFRFSALKLVPIGISWSLTSVAAEAKLESTCIELGSAKDLIQCALNRSPELGIAQESFESYADHVGGSTGWSNPQIGGEYTFSDQYGQTQRKTAISLDQPIDLFRAPARRKAAEADRIRAEADLLETRQRVTVETVVDLFRVKHLSNLIAFYEEAISTFNRVQGIFRGRGRLSPENQVNTMVFELARQDYALKKAVAEGDLVEAQRRLELVLQTKLASLEKVFPKEQLNWPKASSFVHDEAHLRTPDLVRTEADLKAAEAEVSRVRSEAIPIPTIGPRVEFEQSGVERFTTYGIGLSFDLPFWNLNIRNSRFAGTQRDLAQRKLVFEKERQRVVRENLVLHYGRAVEALAKTATLGEISKKHHNIEALFSRGIVSAPLVIESHRQLLEFIESKQGHELEAIESLWSMLVLENRVEEGLGLL